MLFLAAFYFAGEETFQKQEKNCIIKKERETKLSLPFIFVV